MDGYGIFISYRHVPEAKGVAILIREYLLQQFPGIPVFRDGDCIEFGQKWPDEIQGNLARCKILLALIHEGWGEMKDPEGIRLRLDYEDDWVRNEIAIALADGKLVIPVIVNAARRPKENLLPNPLKGLLQCQEAKFRLDDLESDREAIAQRVRDVLPEAARPRPAAKPETSTDGLIDPQTVAELITEATDEPHVLFALARSQQDKGRGELASALLAEAEKVNRQRKKPKRSFSLAVLNQRASQAYDQGRFAEAEELYAELVKRRKKSAPRNEASLLSSRHNHATAILSQGRAAEAEALFRDQLSLQERVQGPEHPDTLSTRHVYADALLAQGKAAEAEAALRDLLPLRERVQGPEHPGTLRTRRLLARATLEQGAAEQAREQLSALPDGGDQPPAAKAREAMLRGWLADLDGERLAADALLEQAGALLSHLDPAHYLRRELARYRATRGPDGKGGTMIAAEYTKPA